LRPSILRQFYLKYFSWWVRLKQSRSVFWIIIVSGILFLIITSLNVVWQSIEKSLRPKEPKIVFFKGDKAAYITNTTIRDAYKILKDNPSKFDKVEIDY